MLASVPNTQKHTTAIKPSRTLTVDNVMAKLIRAIMRALGEVMLVLVVIMIVCDVASKLGRVEIAIDE